MEGLFSGLVSVCSLSVGVLKSAVGPLAAESIVSAQGTALARKSLASVLITSAVGGAASEAAEEIGHQLIIEARQPSRIDYRRVGVSAAFGTLIASGSTLAGASLNRLKEVRAAKKVEKAAKSAGNALPTERNLRYFAKDVVEGGSQAIKNALPNVENTTINPKKLTEYALNPDHPVGGNKAKVFESALGYNQSNADDLMRQIYEKLPNSEAVLGTLDEYGQRYTVDILISGPNGNTVNVRTGWIIKTGSDVPELTTLFVND